jgi:hypothetical protein
LGRKAFVRLGSADELSQKPQNILEGEGGNHGGNGNQGDEGGW